MADVGGVFRASLIQRVQSLKGLKPEEAAKVTSDLSNGRMSVASFNLISDPKLRQDVAVAVQQKVLRSKQSLVQSDVFQAASRGVDFVAERAPEALTRRTNKSLGRAERAGPLSEELKADVEAAGLSPTRTGALGRISESVGPHVKNAGKLVAKTVGRFDDEGQFTVSPGRLAVTATALGLTAGTAYALHQRSARNQEQDHGATGWSAVEPSKP